MPTSATGTLLINRRRGRDGRVVRAAAGAAGFTLIEILVVVLIIGVVSAGILLAVSLTGRDRDLEREGARLYTLINYAREQAELQTREYGLLFQEDGYEFLSYDVQRGHWSTVPEDEVLAQRKLPAGLEVKLIVEAHPIVLRQPQKDADKVPQVMIFSDGDLSSFAATLERDAGLRSITVTEDDKGQLVEQPMVETHP